MKPKNISEQVLETIKKKHINPKPRWTFLLKDYTIWAIGLFSLVIGSFAFSMVIFLTKNNDWDIYKYIDDSLLQFVLLSLPYLWIVFLVFFVLAADYNFKHTKRGYKHGSYAIVLGTVFISIILGTFLYNVGVGQALDEIFSKKIPFYEELFQRHKMRWAKPEEGFLLGKVQSVVDNKNFTILDMRGNEWQIISEHTGPAPLPKIETGENLRIIGKRIGDNKFKADLVLPARPHMKRWFCENCGPDRPPMLPMQNSGDKKRPGDKIIRDEMKKIGKACWVNNDCGLPFMYAVRSSCPFEAKCINEKCKVVCPGFSEAVCASASDCDCEFYKAEDRKACVCVDGQCVAVVVE